MNLRVTRKDITGLIKKLRKNIPALVLRTSIIVGFPGETEKDFRELLGFIRATKFERLGAFVYSRESGTRASRLENQVPETVKKERFDELMKVQQRISEDANRSFIGKTVEVLIDEKLPDEKNEFIGRTQWDAPEIDGLVHVSGKGIRIGDLYKVKINDALEYDLIGNKI